MLARRKNNFLEIAKIFFDSFRTIVFFQKKMAAVRSLGRINPKTSAVFLCDMQVFWF